jgi:hypothetical protein
MLILTTTAIRIRNCLSFIQGSDYLGKITFPWLDMANKSDAIAKALFHKCSCGETINNIDDLQPTFQGNYLYNKISDQQFICVMILFFGSVISIAAIAKIYNLRQKIKMQQSLG